MRSFSQYLLADEQPVWAFQSGLFFSNGKPKPALDAYRLPIYVRKAGRGVVVWGRVPVRGEVTIRPSRGRATKVRVTDSHGYFVKRLRTRAPSYRLAFGQFVSRSATPR
jgi:hypothetical protein